MRKKLRIVLSGIGNRALPKKPESSNWLGWVELIRRSEDFQLVAAHDVSDLAIKRIIDRDYLRPEQTYKDLGRMLSETKPDALLVTNPPELHASAIRKALEYNLHLLVEKPFVKDLKEGRKLLDLIEQKGVVTAVVQNWRFKDVGRMLHDAIQNGMLGRVGHVFFRYIRNRENPTYPEYIFKEKLPLLYAMGIHHLDLFRYILKDEYKSVKGCSFKPPWTLYKSDTGINLFLKTKKGISVIYSGTISSTNKVLMQESLIIEGDKGTLVNEGQWLEPPLWFYPGGCKDGINLAEKIKNGSIPDQYNKSDEYILKDFYQAIVNKKEPLCTARDALESVAVLEASRLACETEDTVYLN